MRKDLLIKLFKTGLWAVMLLNGLFLSAQNLTEDFEAVDFPTEWTLVDGSNNTAVASISAGNAYTGSQCLLINGTATGSRDLYLVSPQLKLSQGDQTLSFWYKALMSGRETFSVGWSSNGTNVETDFTWSDPITDAVNTYQQFQKNDLI